MKTFKEWILETYNKEELAEIARRGLTLKKLHAWR